MRSDMNKMTRNEIVALYERGKKEGFAIPAFNYSDIWDMMAIVKAAEEAQSPVLLMCDPPTYEEFGGRLCECAGNPSSRPFRISGKLSGGDGIWI